MSVPHVPDSDTPIASAKSGSTPDTDLAGVRALADMLAGVPDPRKVRGRRHRIGAVLAVMVCAALAGPGNFRELDDRAAELPPGLLGEIGCRRRPVTGGYRVPSEAMMRRIARAIDADAADERVCRWLREQAHAAVIARTAQDAMVPGDTTLLAVAMDGKVIRNTIAPGGAEGSEIKLFSALLHEQAIVIAQRRIPEGTNEITQVADLLAGIDLTNVVVTGDAAHAQHATAAHIAVGRMC